MRVLLTGAAGFIGAHVRSALATAGHDVLALDALLPSAHAEPPEDMSLHRIDVRDSEALDDALAGIDVVCHQAAVVGAGVSQQDAPAYASHNDFGTAVLLAAMERAGCRKLVLASSMVVYGEGRYRAGDKIVVPAPRNRADLDAGRFDNLDPDTGERLSWDLVDEDAPLQPRSTYAASKLAQENYALAWSAATGGTVVALRYHNVYGPNMPRNTPYSGVAAMFRSALEAGRPPTVYEDGKQMRDFVHVADVAAANVAASDWDGKGFTAFNVCSGTPISIAEVASIVAEARGGPAPVITGQYRSGDVRHIVASPVKAAAELKFTAQITPREGLAEFAFAPLRETGAVSQPSP
ncbi:NAD-dependent epimerase/dehydratase family protein [Skermania sp. ID1734]|uniref:NAD-dependent epimerase/dehydratase family protein n=1 Tax=Skermania sp. ID1734 TaxID=2597516 RepID=UPI00117FAE01|nr:NAD-dependent epimerase/dehydratase family protein [Skermania sp. ID1734]TSE02121.1 NAD-dependent epimerase/dehydratase family protein [Skermania sp. ID1734]